MGDFLAEHCSAEMISIDDLAARAVRFKEYRGKRHFISLLERWLYGNVQSIQYGTVGLGKWYADFKGAKIKYLRIIIHDQGVVRQGNRNR